MEDIELMKGYPALLETHLPEQFNKLKKSLIHMPETLVGILYDLHKFGKTVYYDTYLTLLGEVLLDSDDLSSDLNFRNSSSALLEISNILLGTHPFVKGFLKTYSRNLKERFSYLANIRKKVLEEADKVRGEVELETGLNSVSWQNK